MLRCIRCCSGNKYCSYCVGGSCSPTYRCGTTICRHGTTSRNCGNCGNWAVSSHFVTYFTRQENNFKEKSKKLIELNDQLQLRMNKMHECLVRVKANTNVIECDVTVSASVLQINYYRMVLKKNTVNYVVIHT